jgi:hypothetical protein
VKVSTRIFPWKDLEIMPILEANLLDFLLYFLEKYSCKVLKNQDRKLIESLCCTILKCPLEARDIAWSTS